MVLREPEGGVSTADACKQTWLLVDGLIFQLVYELTEGLTGFNTITSSDTTISSAVEFNGEQTFEASSLLEIVSSITPEQIFEITNLSYLNATEANESLLIHGSIETRMENGSTLTTNTSNTPAEQRRFDLSKEGSYSQTYEQNKEVQANGIPLQDSSMTVEYETLYEGRETIIVPAGVFEACKFSVSAGPRRAYFTYGAIVEIDNSDEINEFWISTESGLLVRRLKGLDEELLLEATIAGQAITGSSE